MSLKVGVTGQSGFIGGHLFNYLKLCSDVERVAFDKTFFNFNEKLKNFVSQCDVIVHLAGMSRHENQQFVYDTNILLTNKLIDAMTEANKKLHLIFISTTHDYKNTPYHASKRETVLMFEKWAASNNSSLTVIKTPNVFGPYSRPFFNSVVSTFCHQIANNEAINLIGSDILCLVDIQRLCNVIKKNLFFSGKRNIVVPHEFELTLTDLASKLKCYKESLDNLVIPELKSLLDIRLFNTFISYLQ